MTALFVLFFYGLLLGEKNVVRLLIAAVCITLVLYIVFSGMLSVKLRAARSASCATLRCGSNPSCCGQEHLLGGDSIMSMG